jgi:putative transposase
VYRCQYHVIFCPKYRRKVLTDAVAVRMKELVLAQQADYGYILIAMDVMPNHIHLLLDVDPSVGITSVVAKIKAFP